MFYILSQSGNEVVGKVHADTLDLKEIAEVYGQPVIVTEALNFDDEGRAAIPAELDRAIDAWNLMTTRVPMHIDKVEVRERHVKPYRRWKKEAGRRKYTLEQLIPDVEAQPYLWPTIRFSWLFGSKNGELNSQKIRDRAFMKAGGNGHVTEADRELHARNEQYDRDNPGWREKVHGGPNVEV